MAVFFRFLYEMLAIFFSGLIHVVKAIGASFGMTFDFKGYISLVNHYKADLSGPEWVLVGLVILIMIAIIVGAVLLIIFLIRKYMRFRKTLVDQESLLEEIAELN